MIECNCLPCLSSKGVASIAIGDDSHQLFLENEFNHIENKNAARHNSSYMFWCRSLEVKRESATSMQKHNNTWVSLSSSY